MYRFAVWKQVNGSWTRMADVPDEHEAERLSREHVFGEGSMVTPVKWNREQVAAAANGVAQDPDASDAGGPKGA